MATYMITFDERTADGKHIMEFLQKNKKIIDVKPSKLSDSKKSMSKLDLAIEELEQGKTIKCKNFDDYLKKVK